MPRVLYLLTVKLIEYFVYSNQVIDNYYKLIAKIAIKLLRVDTFDLIKVLIDPARHSRHVHTRRACAAIFQGWSDYIIICHLSKKKLLLWENGLTSAKYYLKQ